MFSFTYFQMDHYHYLLPPSLQGSGPEVNTALSKSGWGDPKTPSLTYPGGPHGPKSGIYLVKEQSLL